MINEDAIHQQDLKDKATPLKTFGGQLSTKSDIKKLSNGFDEIKEEDSYISDITDLSQFDKSEIKVDNDENNQGMVDAEILLTEKEEINNNLTSS